jgi:hypothetical protein
MDGLQHYSLVRRSPRISRMQAFLDFEASSLSKQSYPIEVAWVFADGRSESWLIRPAPDWQDWDERAEAIHQIPRHTLLRDGAPHDLVARRMVEALSGHELFASAPSWDGKWLSVLLRAAGLGRGALQLRKSGDALRELAVDILQGLVPPAKLEEIVADLLILTRVRCRAEQPAHRALADAEQERRCWLAIETAATLLARRLGAAGTPASD